MLTRRSIIFAAAVGLCGCVPSHYTPVTACPVGADGKHPSSGPLVVLPSEVPHVELDSMHWFVHTGHEGEEFGTWTSVAAGGRMVSTKEVPLVGVGVLFEGMRDDVVVHRMIDSNFYDYRRNPAFSQAGTIITRETVRPDRPVQVGAGEKDLTHSPPSRWGCPTRARIIRLSPPGTPLRAPRQPEDERAFSDFYNWNPWTFSLDTILRLPRNGIALLRGADGDAARTEVVVVRTKVLYRRFDQDGVRADSSRLRGIEFDMLPRGRDSAEMRGAGPGATRDSSTPIPDPKPGEAILMIGLGGRRYQWRFPTASPPPQLALLFRTLTQMGDRLAPTARPNTPR